MQHKRSSIAPLDSADSLRQQAYSELASVLTAGQVFTPQSVAQLMAAMMEAARRHVRLLEPGAGTGVLIAAAVERLEQQKRPPDRIDVTAVESDERLHPYLYQTLALCEEHCRERGIAFTSEVVSADFVDFAVNKVGQRSLMNGDSEDGLSFSVIIMNPPYSKINMHSRERRLLSAAGIEVSNIYAGFVALAARLLQADGQLIAITPRSFCNGAYFKRFRRELLHSVTLREMYLFDSREAAFSDSSVLQENLIFRAVKQAENPSTVSIGVGNGDTASRATRNVEYDRVVWPCDKDYIIRIVPSEAEQRISDWMKAQPEQLHELGVSVSTGRVVDFRADDLLRRERAEGALPLIYPVHLRGGLVKWPADVSKPNWIAAAAEQRHLLVPTSTYVLVKRFTSKEERRRVVASVLEPDCFAEYPFLGFENHLNYFHAKGAGMEPNLAYGLAAYLNTTNVDRFFRQFSGHTQVNAGDLRMLRYPSIEALRIAGKQARECLRQGRGPDWDDILYVAARKVAA